MDCGNDEFFVYEFGKKDISHYRADRDQAGWITNKIFIGRDIGESSRAADGSWVHYGEKSHFFKGKVKSVRIYNRRLTDEEIENNYKIDNQRYNIK